MSTLEFEKPWPTPDCFQIWLHVRIQGTCESVFLPSLPRILMCGQCWERLAKMKRQWGCYLQLPRIPSWPPLNSGRRSPHLSFVLLALAYFTALITELTFLWGRVGETPWIWGLLPSGMDEALAVLCRGLPWSDLGAPSPRRASEEALGAPAGCEEKAWLTPRKKQICLRCSLGA